jgi:hypothetical protein
MNYGIIDLRILKTLALWSLLTIKSYNPFIFISTYDLVLLTRKPLDFKASFQISNLTLTLH